MMPVLSYPGVYIEEIPSGVRTITGVATSITAFIGRALTGPVNKPIRIQTFGDFERQFGGLWSESTLSYAVQQYFLNGGTDAIIVRLVNSIGTNARVELFAGEGESLILEANPTLEEGHSLRVSVDYLGVSDNQHFNLLVTEIDENGDAVETPTLFPNLSIDEIVEALEVDSSPLRVNGDSANNLPTRRLEEVSDVPLTDGSVTLAATRESLLIEAVTPGTEGNSLRVSINYEGVTDDGQHFNLLVNDTNENENPVVTFSDLTINQIVQELNIESSPIRVANESRGNLPSVRLDEVSNAPLTDGRNIAKARIILPVTNDNPLILEAANEGSWGNQLRAQIDHQTSDPEDETLFNLTIEYFDENDENVVIARETFRNVSVQAQSRRFIGEVLPIESSLIATAEGTELPSIRPNATRDNFIVADGTGNDGLELNDSDYQEGSSSNKIGIYALEDADLFNLLCIPPLTRDRDLNPAVWVDALNYCHQRRAMLIVDPPQSWNRKDAVIDNLDSFLNGWSHKENAMLYFPRTKLPDPLKENRLTEFVACGVIAGVMARIDAQRGVWKASAGIEATLTGVKEFTVKLTDGENGQLNQKGVNCLRSFPVYGNVVWGARTLLGDDRFASEWKYIPVRRLALFLEESLYRGTQWVVFEPNDEPLWAQIRLNIGAFLNTLFRQGAFQGKTPREAYFVKCDKETTTQNDINQGIVNIIVGYAPLKPAEFVVLKFQQIAGQIAA